MSKYDSALCILTIKPNDNMINRLAKIVKSRMVDIYIICDGYTENIKTRGVNIVHITDDESIDNGYVNAVCGTIEKECTAWDKAMYYFTKVKTEYKFVWFMEDDVYIPDNAFQNLHKKYVNVNGKDENSMVDYVVANNNENLTGEETEWSHWKTAIGKLDYPLYKSMVCAVGMSRRTLDVIKKYVNDNWSMVFLEVMFNTLVMQNGLNMVLAPEFSTIHYQYDWSLKDLRDNPNNLFHPVKY